MEKTADIDKLKEESEKNIEQTCNIFQSYFEWDEEFLIDGVKEEAKIDGDHSQIKPAEKVTEHFKLSTQLGYTSFYKYVRTSIKEREDQKNLIKYLIMLKRFAVMLPTLDIYISSRMSKRQEPPVGNTVPTIHIHKEKEVEQFQHNNTFGNENDETQATMNPMNLTVLKIGGEQRSITPRQQYNPLDDTLAQMMVQPHALALDKRSSSMDRQVREVQLSYEVKLLKKEQEIIRLKKEMEYKRLDQDFDELYGYQAHAPLFKFKYDKEILQMRHRVFNRLPINESYPSHKFKEEKNHLLRVQSKNGDYLAFGGSILKGLQAKYKERLEKKGDKSFTVKIHIDHEEFSFNIAFEYHEFRNIVTARIRNSKAPDSENIQVRIKRLFKGPIVQYCNHTVWYDDEDMPIVEEAIIRALNKARYQSSITGSYKAVYSQKRIEPVDKEAFEAEQAQQALISAVKQNPPDLKLEQQPTAGFGGVLLKAPTFDGNSQDDHFIVKSKNADKLEEIAQKKKEEMKSNKHYQALHKKVYSGAIMQVKSEIKKQNQQYKEQIKQEIEKRKKEELRQERKQLQREHKQKFKEVEETIVISKQRGRPYCILNQMREAQLLCRYENESIMFWNYLETFKSNFKGNQSKGQFATLEKIDPVEFEYKYVAYKFARTFSSEYHKEHRDISKAVKHMFYKTNLHDYKRIVSIEKVINPLIYQRVELEFKRMLFTYENVTAEQIAKHLFISCNVNPEKIYNTHDGFNQSFFKRSHYGTGLYFSENSRQCIDGAFAISDKKTALGQYHQMFLSLVLVGRPALNAGKHGLTHPPLKPNSSSEHYDSIYQEESGKYIVFDDLKVYPGYLITFK